MTSQSYVLPAEDTHAGFTVTATAYRRMVERTGIAQWLQECEASGDSARAQQIIRRFTLPADVAAEILSAYRALGAGRTVTLRSSGLDPDEVSVTGVRGDTRLLLGVVDCWAALYGPSALLSRAARGGQRTPSLSVHVHAG